jgi:hypothetical protein
MTSCNFSASPYGLRLVRVPLIAAVLRLCEFSEPLTTAGLGLRWRTLLSDGAVGRTTPGVRTTKA